MDNNNEKDFDFFLSSFPPRKCGIVVFTNNLYKNIIKINKSNLLDFEYKIAAINEGDITYSYPNEVIYNIGDNNANNFIKISDYINKYNSLKLINIQHEFKLYGTIYGERILFFLRNIRKPVITAFHTLLPKSSEERRNIVREISEKSQKTVLLTKAVGEILKKKHNISPDKIVYLPHGVPDYTIRPREEIKNKFNLNNKIVLISFGFLRPGNCNISSGRGYENVIDALREFLKVKIQKLKLERYLRSIDKYIAKRILCSI
jgi:hypothetical protein